LGIAWFCGLLGFYTKGFSNGLDWVLGIIYAFSPAVIAIIMNKNEGGTWKNLKFIKPSAKSVLLAILIPVVITAILRFVEIYFGLRSKLDWDLIQPASFYIFNISLMFVYVFAEEVGWRGYLQEKLINEFGGLKGVALLGIVWGLWHLPVIVLTGRNFPNYPLFEALIWYPISSIAVSYFIAYVGHYRYSIYIAILIHMTLNINGYFIGPLSEMNSEWTKLLISIVFYPLMIMIFGFGYWKKKRFTTKPINNTGEGLNEKV